MGRARDAREADLEPPPVAPDACSCACARRGSTPSTRRSARARWRAVPLPFPLILGWDVAGVVEKAGPAVTGFKPGDEVYGYCRRHHLQYGTYARVRHGARRLLRPQARVLSFEEAAALPLAGLTAHQSLETMGVRGGETFFVTGGAGGVGHLAVQLAVAPRRARDRHRLGRATTTSCASSGPTRSTTRRATSPRACASSPATAAPTPPSTCSAATVASRRSRRLRSGGRLASIAPAAARAARRLRVPLPVRAPDGDDLRELAELVEDGRLRPHVEEAFPLERAAEAHERLEGGHVRGKLVLSVS